MVGTGGARPLKCKGAIIRVRDICAEPLHGTVPGKLPAHGCQADNEEADEATGGEGLGVPTAGYSDGGGGF